MRENDLILSGKLERSQVRPVAMRLFVSEKMRYFADFIDEIGYFDMYFEWKCGYYRKRLREDFMILGRKLERL